MKTLQSFKELSISKNEEKHVLGGLATPVSGSFTAFGSTFSYSGELSLSPISSTGVGGSLSAGIGGINASHSTTSYTSDFCGTTSFDGGSAPGCAYYMNGRWVITN